uniref:BTB domain-containing protein n=1 Tax=Spongospora subterranea TaxID=70186 RepID=A0A0H5QTG0_9EUKA|eukprot:CRZ04841.1 hypothetical protein [Spongospora subterranea]
MSADSSLVSMATDMRSALEALFYNESSSDLVVRLSESKFYVHKAVMMPTCAMIEQCVKWPQDDTDNGSGSRAQCDIVLPDLTVPVNLWTVPLPPFEANRLFRLFDLFLRTVYGLVHPSEYRSAQDVFSVLIIANYMMSDKVKGRCELDLVKRIEMHLSNVPDLIVLCRKYNLSDLREQILQYVGENPNLFDVYKHILVKMEIEEFLDLLALTKFDPLTRHEVLLKYCSQVSPDIHNIPENGDIKITQRDRLECLIQGYHILSKSWTTWSNIRRIGERTRRIVVNLESGPDDSHLVLFQVLVNQMYTIPNICPNCRKAVW